jgi:hypothetical protein
MQSAAVAVPTLREQILAAVQEAVAAVVVG